MTKEPSISAPAFSADTALQAEGEIIATANRLAGYRVYLAQARAYKSSLSDPGARRSLDNAVLAQAEQARDDVWALATQALSVTRALNQVGELDRFTQSWFDDVRSAGNVTVSELWPRAKKILKERGASKVLVSEMDQGLGAHDIQVSADGSGVLLQLKQDGAVFKQQIEPKPTLGTPNNIVELMTRGRNDRLIDMIARQEPAYLLGAPTFDGTARLEDVILASALSATREAVRHVRKLQDSGLATYDGASPGFLVGWEIAGAVIVVVGVILMAIFCKDDAKSDLCEFGGFLFGLGWLVILFPFVFPSVKEYLEKRSKEVKTLEEHVSSRTVGGGPLNGVLLHPSASP
jgi:hypothetical protein